MVGIVYVTICKLFPIYFRKTRSEHTKKDYPEFTGKWYYGKNKPTDPQPKILTT